MHVSRREKVRVLVREAMGGTSSTDQAEVYTSAKRGVILEDGDAAFVGLCAGGHLKLAKRLVERVTIGSTLALAAAVRHRHGDVVNWLLEVCAAPEVVVALAVARPVCAASCRAGAATAAADKAMCKLLRNTLRSPKPRHAYLASLRSHELHDS